MEDKYQIEIIEWCNYQIKVMYAYDPMRMAEYYDEPMSHIQIVTIEPERAALPITDTGYKSHFIPESNIAKYGSAKDYVLAWLNEAATSPAWIKAEEERRQYSLF